jgi:hypothetical protein
MELQQHTHLNPENLLQLAKDFVRAVENRKTPEELRTFYHPDVVQTEYPNLLSKTVISRNLADLELASEKGKHILLKETYEIIQSHVSGNVVILEVIWRGILAVPLGQIPIGGQMKAYFAQIFEFKDGKIFRQRNYDCFEPI